MTDNDEIKRGIHELIPILGKMGIEVVTMERNEAAARLPAGPNVNHFGVAYAGSLFTVAEVLGGLFANTSLQVEGGVPLVKRMEIDFLLPAFTDVVSRATLEEAEIERILAEFADRGKSNFELVADVSDDDGNVVARTHGYYQLRRMG